MKKSTKKASSGVRLLAYLKPYWKRLAVGVAAMLAVTLINLSYPYIVGVGIFDQVLTIRKSQALLNLAVLVALVIIVSKQFFTFLQNYSLQYVGQRIVADLRFKLFQHLQNMSIGFHETRRTGEMVSRVINDITLIQSSLSVGLFQTVFYSAELVGIVVITFYLHWRLAFLAFIVFPLAVLVASRVGRLIRTMSRLAQEKTADLAAILQETLAGIRIIKAFTMEEQEEDRFRQKNEANFQANLRSVKASALLTPLVEFFFLLAIVVVLWYGGREVILGKLTVGELIAFFGYIAMTTSPINRMTQQFSLFQQSFAAADRVFEILDQEPEIREAPDAVVLPKIRGEVVFSGVSFAYPKGEVVLSDINLHVQPGEIVALVGPSGAGKTSLVNLIPRFYDPLAGSIFIDGHDIRKIRLSSLREQIGLVPQDPILFGVSIKENISYGRVGATDEEIVAAAKAANAHEFIMKFPDGYDTVLGERGLTVSGGERQRIAVARALLRNPSILILDEATSALDVKSEQLVQEALERLMKGRTAFIIAHRLSTIQFADRIVVLDQGRIVEEGSHNELLAEDGLYSRLYNRWLKDTRKRGDIGG
ncbi:MAG: ABC transporter ATP-binding protein [Firmicutes bacterium]|jgi:subfamily B ATP-binding cassette protein MsbA|nr:ABC transporter ATP-binding protein [Bacillota bacterium]